jgi:hypothetical protein
VHDILNEVIDSYLKVQVFKETAIITDEPIHSLPVAHGIVEDLI